MIKWKLEKRKLSELFPHPNNPRRLSEHDGNHLQKSLTKFGLIDKPIINPDGMIIGGHQRIEILKKMGQKTVDCYVPDKSLEEKDIDELNIRLNRNSGEWDYDILANSWNEKDLLEFGFKEEEFSITLGSDNDYIEEKEDTKNKNKNLCPNCGHEL